VRATRRPASPGALRPRWRAASHASLHLEPHFTAHPARRFPGLFFLFLRIQETLDLNACDLHLERPHHVRLRGKGNKERISPLWPETAAAVRELLAQRGIAPTSTAPVFVNQRGERLSRDGTDYLLKKHVRAAAARAPTLVRKRLHPHSFRHTTAVHMRRAGDDYAAIAALLGHAHPTTTESIYGHIDLDEKRKAIEANPPPVRK
jgi:integrase